MMVARRRGNDLFLGSLGPDGGVTLKDWFRGATHRVARIEFADGTVWGEAELFDLAEGRPMSGHGATEAPPRGWRDDGRVGSWGHRAQDEEVGDRPTGGSDRIAARLAQGASFEFEALNRALGTPGAASGAVSAAEIARQWAGVQRYVKALDDIEGDDRRDGFLPGSVRGGREGALQGANGSGFGYDGSIGAARAQDSMRALDGLREGFRQL
jgi:hypothetical protein